MGGVARSSADLRARRLTSYNNRERQSRIENREKEGIHAARNDHGRRGGDAVVAAQS
jgi:hypothetical protein